MKDRVGFTLVTRIIHGAHRRAKPSKIPFFAGNFPKRPFSLKTSATFTSGLSDLAGGGLGYLCNSVIPETARIQIKELGYLR